MFPISCHPSACHFPNSLEWRHSKWQVKILQQAQTSITPHYCLDAKIGTNPQLWDVGDLAIFGSRASTLSRH